MSFRGAGSRMLLLLERRELVPSVSSLYATKLSCLAAGLIYSLPYYRLMRSVCNQHCIRGSSVLLKTSPLCYDTFTFPNIFPTILTIYFVHILTRCEEDDGENDQRHNSQDHHHGDPYALPVPRRTICTAQVLMLKSTQTHKHCDECENSWGGGH